jgi:hypothetical protein
MVAPGPATTPGAMAFPERGEVVDVTLRDGLQSLPGTYSTRTELAHPASCRPAAVGATCRDNEGDDGPRAP